MADGRMLKRTISIDKRVAQLSAHSALLYTLAIPHLDRDGRLSGHPIIVRGTVVPSFAFHHRNEWTDELVETYMDEWLQTIEEDGRVRPLVLRYCIRGVWACWFPGFKNQKIRYDREAVSVLPPPPPDLVERYGLTDAVPEPLTPEEEDAALRSSLRNRAQQMEHRARVAGVEWEHVDLYAVAERYGWTCYLCHRAIDLKTGQRSESLSFDHVLPVSLGGPHTAENLAPAHFGCNAGKCDRIVDDQITIETAGAVPPPLDPSLALTPGVEAEAEVQDQHLPGQREVSRARADRNLAALPEDEHLEERDPLAEAVLAGVARRQAALATHGPLAPLLALLPDADENTPRTLHALFDPLGDDETIRAAVGLTIHELEIYQGEIRRPSAYVVGIAKRLASTHRRRARGRRSLSGREELAEQASAEAQWERIEAAAAFEAGAAS